MLAKTEIELIPTTLTPRLPRRTFASILFANGEAPPHATGQLRHTTAELTLALYARQMDRHDGEPERLRALVEGRDRTARRQGNGGQAAEPTADNVAPVEQDRQKSQDFQPVRSITRP